MERNKIQHQKESEDSAPIGSESEGTIDVLVAWYSGTGSTRHAAIELAHALKARGRSAALHRIQENAPMNLPAFRRLVVMYAVHALNASRPAGCFLQALPASGGTPASVISVSGGGEMFPNTGCRIRTIRALERKGYEVDSEHMLVMPSNFAVTGGAALPPLLLTVLPKKLERILDGWDAGVRNRTQPSLANRVFAWLGEFEKLGTPHFGRGIRVLEACDGCGACAQVCAAGNIRIENGRAVIGKRCVMCMGCLYRCPMHALKAPLGRSLQLESGYDMARWQAEASRRPLPDIMKSTEGLAWLGVRRYLLEDEAYLKEM